MARRHWLDPLARKVLQAMGDLPPDPAPPAQETPTPSLELELSAAESPTADSLCIDVNRASAEQWRQLDVQLSWQTICWITMAPPCLVVGVLLS